ncbi:MAG: KpsF/GutQ family sugar-phosphate isomerase [Elusimicrobia bacterium]|nr:KpsF/GutQ family sugar-phosphate isomerase [Elusimicrobiota bacterium]
MKNKRDNSKHLLIRCGKEVINREMAALASLSKGLNRNFANAVKMILDSTGRVVVVGIGKSGIIGRKIAATLSSTGTPSIYLHPVECLHGDMGMVGRKDVALALSYSGETHETALLLQYFKSRGHRIISITNNLNSKLAKHSDITLNLNVRKEACPFNIVPTSSTAAMLSLGDAIAITLMKIKNFDKAELARLHPGGSLGKLLNTKVKDLMHKGKENPVIKNSCLIKDALYVMTKTRLGAASVTDGRGRLIGFFTDGDLRRYLQKGETSLNKKITSVMTRNPITVHPDTMAAEAARIMSRMKIDNIPVIDPETKKPVGIIDERDLLNEGLL